VIASVNSADAVVASDLLPELADKVILLGTGIVLKAFNREPMTSKTCSSL
jgi:hypothetical protein